jgi:hypothetical protein
MIQRATAATRLDMAVDGVLAGRPTPVGAESGLDAGFSRLAALAADLREALPAPVLSPAFEARLGARLSGVTVARDPIGWVLRHPTRILVTGAVGSAAVGVGITAFAAWRSGHRSRGVGTRLLQR